MILIPRSGSPHDLICRSGSSHGLIPQSGSSHDLIPRCGSSHKLIPRSGSSHGLLPWNGSPCGCLVWLAWKKDAAAFRRTTCEENLTLFFGGGEGGHTIGFFRQCIWFKISVKKLSSYSQQFFRKDSGTEIFQWWKTPFSPLCNPPPALSCNWTPQKPSPQTGSRLFSNESGFVLQCFFV